LIPVSVTVCLTNNEGPVKNASCKFPFIFEELKYTGCTRDHDPRNKLWCSTEVDDEGFHIPRKWQWGYCSENCEEHTEVSLKQISFIFNQ